MQLRISYGVNALNSGSLPITGNRPQSGLSVCNRINGHRAVHQCVMGPKAAKRFIIVQSDQFPVFSSLPEVTLVYDKFLYNRPKMRI